MAESEYTHLMSLCSHCTLRALSAALQNAEYDYEGTKAMCMVVTEGRGAEEIASRAYARMGRFSMQVCLCTWWREC